MGRKEAILSMRQILIKRRDALRTALAGDLSLLKELRAQTAGDVVDAALDCAQDEISSQLAEVESRELASTENALRRMSDSPNLRDRLRVGIRPPLTLDEHVATLEAIYADALS